jgi:hypothetical protein
VTVLYAAGDGATGGSDAATVAETIRNAKPDGFLYAGDVYESGTASEFAANYKPTYGLLDAICYPCPGNHDWGNYLSGYKPYFDAAGRPSDPWYAVAWGDWQLLVFNSESPSDPSSLQYRWAQAQLQPSDLAVNARKRIAMWHRPRFCSGSHGDATDMDALYQLVAPHCCVLVSGHAHNLQHFHPDATGCQQIVTGAGGRGLYAELPNDPRLEWGEASGYGAVCLELGDTLGVTYVDETGTTLYTATLTP